MVQRIVDKIIEKQLKENVITVEEVNIYRYGYTLVCEVIINIFIAVIIGIAFRELTTVLLFLCMYIPLRSFCGGWHADKIWKCTILSNIILLILVLVDKYLIENCDISIMVIAFIVCLSLVFLLAPVDTKTKPLTVDEKRVYKRKINVMLILHILIMMIMVIFNLKNIVFIICFMYVVQSDVLIFEIISKKSKNNCRLKKGIDK